ncbi:mobile element MPME [Mycolicibacterium phage phi1_186001]
MTRERDQADFSGLVLMSVVAALDGSPWVTKGHLRELSSEVAAVAVERMSETDSFFLPDGTLFEKRDSDLDALAVAGPLGEAIPGDEFMELGEFLDTATAEELSSMRQQREVSESDLASYQGLNRRPFAIRPGGPQFLQRAHVSDYREPQGENDYEGTNARGTDVPHLSSEHRDRAWRDRFNARWHYDYGGWIRTRPQDDASTFALIPDERYGPFVEDHSCPYCLVIHPPQECPVLSRYASRTQADTAAEDPR